MSIYHSLNPDKKFMYTETLILYYIVLGVINAFINGAIRKIDADGLLGFAWILLWPMTPLALIVRLIIHISKVIDDYQPFRRLKIFFLRKF